MVYLTLSRGIDFLLKKANSKRAKTFCTRCFLEKLLCGSDKYVLFIFLANKIVSCIVEF